MTQHITIAIDGPVAAGKGTIAALLAKKLYGFHLYSGAMYRCVALYCVRNRIDLHDKNAVINALPHMQFDLEPDKAFLNGEEVTEIIKQRDIAAFTPTIAAIAEVRAALVIRQQEIAAEKAAKGMIVIAEGRDAATKIMPNAFLKIFLTATPEVRARRRLIQMEDLGKIMKFEDVLADTIDRDKKDTERVADPLVSDPKAYGYFIVDDSRMSEEQTIDTIVSELERKQHDSH